MKAQSSKTPVKQPALLQNKPFLAAIAVVALVMVVGVVLLLSQNGGTTTASSQKIDPNGYVSQFSNTSHVLLDVRTPEEFASGHISGAININVDELPNRLSEVPKDEPIVVYCRSGRRSAIAAQLLSDAGYTPIYDLGGIVDWQAAGLPVE